jgi:hypothetical protein
MTDQKPEEKTTKCPYCDKQLPDTWVMQAYDGFVIWVDENHQWTHRHNTTWKGNASSRTTKQKAQQATPTASERDLLLEYFPKGSKIPASARILAKKAASGDLGSLRELDKRFGIDQSKQHTIPVQIAIEGGKQPDLNDPRPIMNINKGILSEGWDEEDEDTQTPIGTFKDPASWDEDDTEDTLQ